MPPRLCGSRCDSPGSTPCRRPAWRRPLAPSTPQHRRPRRGPCPSADRRETLPPPAPGPRAGRGWQLSEKFQPSSSTAGGGRSTDDGAGVRARAESRRDVGVGVPRTREKGQAERPGGGGAGSPSGRSAGAGGAGSRGRGAPRGPGESARTPGGPGERPGSRGWRAAATYLLVRDPRRLLQAEGAAVGAVLRHHAQAAGRAHQLLGVAARGHLGGHNAGGALARRSPPAARGPQPGPSPSGAPPRPASVADSARVQSPSQAQSTDQSVPGIRPAAACSNRRKGTASAPAAGHQ